MADWFEVEGAEEDEFLRELASYRVEFDGTRVLAARAVQPQPSGSSAG